MKSAIWILQSSGGCVYLAASPELASPAAGWSAIAGARMRIPFFSENSPRPKGRGNARL